MHAHERPFGELEEAGADILITVDEVNPDIEEMGRLVAGCQHFVREGKRVALLLARLPHSTSGIVPGKRTSFLRRAVGPEGARGEGVRQHLRGAVGRRPRRAPIRGRDHAEELARAPGQELEIPSNYVSNYKKRLLKHGVIEERPKGVLRFCLPGFREYLAGLED